MIAQNDSLASPPPLGILAEFETPNELVEAVKALRQRGYAKLEAFAPFPIHELNEALRLRSTSLSWLVLAAGVLGGVLAMAGQWWTNSIDYPYIISGKPLFSLPASIPITFEVIILFAAGAAFLGVLMFSGLPRLSNPFHKSERFLRATNDRFFLFVEASDVRFENAETTHVLRNLGASHVEALPEEESSIAIPKPIWTGLVVVGVLALIPPLMIARARVSKSDKPPLAWFSDMDYQPKFKAQTKSKLFSDGRAMRPAISGTVARGELQEDDAFFRGVRNLETKLAPAEPDESGIEPPIRNGESRNNPAWTTKIPLQVSPKLMRRGREQFNIFCANCHGRAGDGNGPVTVRALALEQGTWVPPTSIHAEHVRKQPVGQLYNTITNGVRKMPAYASQISPEDRWAIVLYMQALQRTRQSTVDDLPADEVMKLRDLN